MINNVNKCSICALVFFWRKCLDKPRAQTDITLLMLSIR